jgi:hypothetical protein
VAAVVDVDVEGNTVLVAVALPLDDQGNVLVLGFDWVIDL